MYVINLEMAHESGGADGSPQHTPSPPHAPRLPLADTSFHQQIMQNQSPRKNHIAERAKQTLENNFLLQLKKQQQLQQEILLQHFQQQSQKLAQEHEQQLRHHLKMWEQQKALEEAALREAREAREARERHERERLDLLRKKDKLEPSANASTQVKQKLQEFLKKKAAANANGTVPGSPYRNWGIVKSSSGESITSASAAATHTHPYRLAAPLPLAALNAAPVPPPSPADYPLRKTDCDGSAISPRGSPPGGGVGGVGGAGGTATPIREEEECGRAADLLFSSPSMPNISLGRPHAHPHPHPHTHPHPHPHPHPPPQVSVSLPPVSEAEAFSSGGVGVGGGMGPGVGVGVGPGVGGRLGKRPLGRTHSAPLPLGDPALQPPTAHHYLRDQIRKTVLTRAHDAAAAQLREEEGEVIDLTARRAERADEPGPGPGPGGPVAVLGPGPAVEAAPLARALSSPLVAARAPATGLAYDPIMLKHGCGCGAHAPTHPEHSGRLQSVWARLCETGLAGRCERTRPRKATLEELQCVHSAAHVAALAGRARERTGGGGGGAGGGGTGSTGAAPPGVGAALVRLACGGVGVDADTAWAEHTPAAARAAAGAVLDLALRTARGDLRNGFAVVRPPGHHAETNQAMGFCFFNSVAIAARLLHTRLGLQRILIVDWDVHHGNGTQQIFYEDPHVLYISIHRHDDGNFFPGTGATSECGAGPGLGYNVNVAWGGGTDPPLADAEYLAAFRAIVMPIAQEFNPEVVLVSCGFDAAAGHPAPLGGYRVSPACFAAMTRDLMTLAQGKVVLSLEGGYDLPAVCDCAQECVRALLGERTAPPALPELARPPHRAAQRALRAAAATQAQHWPAVKRYTELIGLSALEASPGCGRRLQSERDAADTAAAMATLSMTHAPLHSRSSESSRSVSEEPMEQDEGK